MANEISLTIDDPDFRVDCPSRLLLDQITDKWSMMVLSLLLHGPQRFNAIKRQVVGVTQRVLTQTLRRLERNGLVRRDILAGRVLGVEYSLTSMGGSLQPPVAALFGWANCNLPQVQEAQRLYDAELQTAEPASHAWAGARSRDSHGTALPR